MFEIKDAVNDRPRYLIGIQGESGTGKTYSALKLARGLVGKDGVIVVIDSEGGRSKVYANDPEIGSFKILELRQPHSSERYRLAFKQAEEVADVVIIDSGSHEHEGMLEYADAEEKRLSSLRNVAIAKWQKPKGERKRFYSAFMTSSKHVIITLRVVVGKDLNQKPPKEIRKTQCDVNLPFEMDMLIELDKQNRAEFIKVPLPLHGHIENGAVMDIRHGQRLAGTITPPPEKTARFLQVLGHLEDAATSGYDTLRNAFEAAGNNCKSEDEKKDLRKEWERLKEIAKNADLANAPDPEEEGAAGDNGNDELFGGKQ